MALLPSRTPSVLLANAASSLGAMLWPSDAFRRTLIILCALRCPIIWFVANGANGEPAEVTALYRPGGDVEYFDLVASLARGNLGESNLYESLGLGLHPFPYASIALHSLLFGLWGAYGLLLADTLTTVAYVALLATLVRRCSLPQTWGYGLAAAIVSNLYVISWPLLKALGVHKALLWGDRFPRPFVSELFFLAVIVYALRLWKDSDGNLGRPFWLGLGLSLSLCLQSDVYSAMTSGVLLVSCAIPRLLQSKLRYHTLKGAGMALGALCVSAWPFALQRSATSPELLRRWGVYELSPLGALHGILDLPIAGVIAVVIAAVFTERLLRASRHVEPTEKRQLQSSVSFLLLLVGAAWVSQTLFCLGTGLGLHLYHFPNRLSLVCAYALCLLALLAAHAHVREKQYRSRLRSLLRWGLVGAVSLGIGARVIQSAARQTHTRSAKHGLELFPNYRAAFSELVRELQNPRYGQAKVLATLDQQVHAFWQSFRQGQSFLPGPFVSLAADQELEERLVAFGRLIKMDTASFLNLVQDRGHNIMFIGLGKYSANSVHHLFALEEYTPLQRARISQRSRYVEFQPEIPPRELQRWQSIYERTANTALQPNLKTKSPRRLDLLLLNNSSRFAALTPPEALFDLCFQNTVFRLYCHRDGSGPRSQRLLPNHHNRFAQKPLSNGVKPARDGNEEVIPERNLAAGWLGLAQ